MIRIASVAAVFAAVTAALVLPGCLTPQADEYSAVYSAWSSDLEGVRKAIAAGVDINAMDKEELNMTPLMAVAANPGSFFDYDNIEYKIAALLIANGADVNLRNNEENTALLYAARTGKSTEFLRLLISRGADVNARNTLARTPLLEMLCNGHTNPDSLRLLIQSGARTDGFDIAGMTVDDYARNLSNTDEILAILYGGEQAQ